MIRACYEELVYTDSEDGILLAGALIRPATEPAKPIAVVYIHGFRLSSFLPLVTNLGRPIASHGYAFLAANTRGHDVGTWLFRSDGQPMLGGAWWERFDESPRDLAAWVNFAMRLGFPGVVLLGFSFGALKAIYYQAERQDARVLGVISAGGPVKGEGRPSPPSLVKAERAALAEQMVAEGRGLDLLPWERYSVPPGTVSAQTYASWARANLDVFGVDTPNPAIAQIRCPVLLCYGTEEKERATAADLDMICHNAKAASRVDIRMIEGAQHGFVGREPEVATAIAGWVDTLPTDLADNRA